MVLMYVYRLNILWRKEIYRRNSFELYYVLDSCRFIKVRLLILSCTMVSAAIQSDISCKQKGSPKKRIHTISPTSLGLRFPLDVLTNVINIVLYFCLKTYYVRVQVNKIKDDQSNINHRLLNLRIVIVSYFLALYVLFYCYLMPVILVYTVICTYYLLI